MLTVCPKLFLGHTSFHLKQRAAQNVNVVKQNLCSLDMVAAKEICLKQYIKINPSFQFSVFAFSSMIYRCNIVKLQITNH